VPTLCCPEQIAAHFELKESCGLEKFGTGRSVWAFVPDFRLNPWPGTQLRAGEAGAVRGGLAYALDKLSRASSGRSRPSPQNGSKSQVTWE
jgi:hypothetical protein